MEEITNGIIYLLKQVANKNIINVLCIIAIVIIGIAIVTIIFKRKK